MNKNIRNRRRYFIVFWEGNRENTTMTGAMPTITSDGGYINAIQFKKDISDYLKLKSVTITNILELSGSDYRDYVKK